MVKQLRLLKTKSPVGKQAKFIIAFDGSVISGHRSLKGARVKFKSLLKKV